MTNLSSTASSDDSSSELCAIATHAKDLAMCLNDFRKTRMLCDVVLLVSGREYFAHRNILCASSPYFLEQLEHVSTDTIGSKLELKNISGEVFEDVLNFIYIGEICVGEENVGKLISASDILHMVSLKDVACRFYEKRLCPSNCLSIAKLADQFNCETLRMAADRFILEHFLDVSQFDEFKHLSCPHLLKIISSDDILVEREEQVYTAAMEWIHSDFEQRRVHLAAIFRCIRLMRTSKYFIFDVLEKNEDLMTNEECVQLINEAKELLNFPDRTLLRKFRKEFSPRRYANISQILVACGGNQERLCTNDVLCYVPSQDFWYPLAPLLYPKFLCSTVVVNNEIFCIGGLQEGGETRNVERYNFTTDKWVEDIPIPEARANHVGCVYNGEVYVIGGGTREKSSSSVIKFNREKGKWEKMKDLIVARRNAAFAVHESLYIIGGYGSDNQPLASMERYDPYRNEWCKTFPMNSARAAASAICIGDNIYVFGGEYATWTYYRSAEIFNILTDEWKNIRDMSLARAYMGISVMKEKIYLMGGMSPGDTLDQYGADVDEEEFVDVNETNLVEIYDTITNTWKIGCSLPVATAGVNCVLITSCSKVVAKKCGF